MDSYIKVGHFLCLVFLYETMTTVCVKQMQIKSKELYSPLMIRPRVSIHQADTAFWYKDSHYKTVTVVSPS